MKEKLNTPKEKKGPLRNERFIGSRPNEILQKVGFQELVTKIGFRFEIPFNLETRDLAKREENLKFGLESLSLAWKKMWAVPRAMVETIKTVYTARVIGTELDIPYEKRLIPTLRDAFVYNQQLSISGAGKLKKRLRKMKASGAPPKEIAQIKTQLEIANTTAWEATLKRTQGFLDKLIDTPIQEEVSNSEDPSFLIISEQTLVTKTYQELKDLITKGLNDRLPIIISPKKKNSEPVIRKRVIDIMTEIGVDPETIGQIPGKVLTPYSILSFAREFGEIHPEHAKLVNGMIAEGITHMKHALKEFQSILESTFKSKKLTDAEKETFITGVLKAIGMPEEEMKNFMNTMNLMRNHETPVADLDVTPFVQDIMQITGTLSITSPKAGRKFAAMIAELAGSSDQATADFLDLFADRGLVVGALNAPRHSLMMMNSTFKQVGYTLGQSFLGVPLDFIGLPNPVDNPEKLALHIGETIRSLGWLHALAGINSFILAGILPEHTQAEVWKTLRRLTWLQILTKLYPNIAGKHLSFNKEKLLKVFEGLNMDKATSVVNKLPEWLGIGAEAFEYNPENPIKFYQASLANTNATVLVSKEKANLVTRRNSPWKIKRRKAIGRVDPKTPSATIQDDHEVRRTMTKVGLNAPIATDIYSTVFDMIPGLSQLQRVVTNWYQKHSWVHGPEFAWQRFDVPVGMEPPMKDKMILAFKELVTAILPRRDTWAKGDNDPTVPGLTVSGPAPSLEFEYVSVPRTGVIFKSGFLGRFEGAMIEYWGTLIGVGLNLAIIKFITTGSSRVGKGLETFLDAAPFMPGDVQRYINQKTGLPGHILSALSALTVPYGKALEAINHPDTAELYASFAKILNALFGDGLDGLKNSIAGEGSGSADFSAWTVKKGAFNIGDILNDESTIRKIRTPNEGTIAFEKLVSWCTENICNTENVGILYTQGDGADFIVDLGTNKIIGTVK